VNRLGVSSRGIYRPRASRFMPTISTIHPDRETLDWLHVSKGKTITIVEQYVCCESCPRRNYVPKVMADFYGMIPRIPEISLN
jgi:hypothetical protein